MELFERKIYNDLVRWKSDDAGSTAVIIDGARRVGKSTVAEEFGKRNYRSYLILDFSEQDGSLRRIFDLFPSDKDAFFDRLQIYFNKKLYVRESLIIFDEVQYFPRAREMIKFLVKDGRYDYLETGSLISLVENTKNIQIPSEERHLSMYPMDFEEFLMAKGEEDAVEILRRAYESESALGDAVHRRMMDLFQRYMLVGGMPQAVSRYMQTGEISSAESVKRQILDLYRADILKIRNKNTAMRAIKLFNGIPSLLSSANKVFLPSKISENGRRSSFATSLEWLVQARLFLRCSRISDPSPAVNMFDDEDTFKCYLLDTGLLFTLAFGNRQEELRENYLEILDGSLGINEGMFFENVIAQELAAVGRPLKFLQWKKSDGRYYEVDFVLDGIRACDLVEVKSAQSARHRSLDVAGIRYADKVNRKIVVHGKDLRRDEDTLYLPAYMAMFL